MNFFPRAKRRSTIARPMEIDDKLDELLRDRDLRERIRRNAIRLAAAQTYDVRAATVLRECGLPFSGLANPRSSTT